MSNIAFKCYTDSLSDPVTSIIRKDEVFLDIYKVLEAKRNRIRKFYKENFVNQEQTPKTSKRSKKSKRKKVKF